MTREQIERALRVYLVADPNHAANGIVEQTTAALAGGVSMVQLRAKAITDRECVVLAARMCQLCRIWGVPFLVNDRLDVALAVEADGVHLGVDDMPIDAARRLLGPRAIVGYSPATDEQARAAAQLGATYLGIGPVFGTKTKGDAGAPVGPAVVGHRAILSGLPVIGIGGINAENAAEVILAGADGVAVVSAILGHPEPSVAAQRLATAVVDALAVRNA